MQWTFKEPDRDQSAENDDYPVQRGKDRRRVPTEWAMARILWKRWNKMTILLLSLLGLFLVKSGWTYKGPVQEMDVLRHMVFDLDNRTRADSIINQRRHYLADSIMAVVRDNQRFIADMACGAVLGFSRQRARNAAEQNVVRRCNEIAGYGPVLFP